MQGLYWNRYDISVVIIDSTLPMIICSPGIEISSNIDNRCVILTDRHKGDQLISKGTLGDRMKVYTVISNAFVNDASSVDCILISTINSHWGNSERSRIGKIFIVAPLAQLIAVDPFLSTSGGKQCSFYR